MKLGRRLHEAGTRHRKGIMKPESELRSDVRGTGTGDQASSAPAGSPPFRLRGWSALLWALPLASLGFTAAAAQAQQPYGYPYGTQPQYAQQYSPPNAPYGYQQPQYNQPQYPQPQYAQPQYAQPAYPQQPNGYDQQPNQYADQNQPYGRPYDDQYGQMPDLGTPAGPTQQPLSAAELEQLLAPIALYPDNLLAQILAASTYPAQVAAADEWMHQMQAQGTASPDQIAAGAEAQSDWDPSVKALTAFPQTLDMLNQNLQWTTALGNAYYNQPQDVMQTVQVLRQRAQQAGNLETTPQEDVTDDQGYIDVAPANPQVVYVPAYDPWDAYGAPISPYPGYSVLGALGSFFGGALVNFGPGIAMAAFDRFPFGWIGWGLSWLSHGIFFNHSPYYTHSATVADWGFPHGGQRVFGPRRVPGNGYRGPQPYNRAGSEFGSARGAAEMRGDARDGYRGEYRDGSPMNGYGRGFATHPEVPGQQAYNRMPAPVNRPQAYAGGENYARSPYGYGSTGRPQENFANRPAMGYDRSYPEARGPAYQSPSYRAPSYQAPSYRAPSYRAPSYQAPSFRQPSYQAQPYRSPEMNPSRGFTGRNEESYGDFARNERSGGFHPFEHEREPKSFREGGFGGGHAPKGLGHERAPKAPKESHSGGGHHGHWR
jgi:hypothetical protein